MTTPQRAKFNTYCIVGKFGEDFNLLVWQIVITSPIENDHVVSIHSECTNCQNSTFTNINLYTAILTNLMPTKFSCYTVSIQSLTHCNCNIITPDRKNVIPGTCTAVPDEKEARSFPSKNCVSCCTIDATMIPAKGHKINTIILSIAYRQYLRKY